MGKAVAVFNGPAVGIGPLIGIGGQKLAYEITVGPMDLNSVKTRGNSTSGSLYETFYNMFDLRRPISSGTGYGSLVMGLF